MQRQGLLPTACSVRACSICCHLSRGTCLPILTSRAAMSAHTSNRLMGTLAFSVLHSFCTAAGTSLLLRDECKGADNWHERLVPARQEPADSPT